MTWTVLRRLRGVALTAAVWALVWALGGALMALVRAAPAGIVLGLSVVSAVCGSVSGILFAVILMLLERHSRLEDLSHGLVTVWGALSGMTIPIVIFVLAEHGLRSPWLFLTVFGVLGATCAAGTLALARRPTAGSTTWLSAPTDAV